MSSVSPTAGGSQAPLRRAVAPRDYYGADAEARRAAKSWIIAALAAAPVAAGVAIAFADVTAAVLCLVVIGSVLIAMDYRVGVVLLILFLPLEPSAFVPHQMFQIIGVNPVNMLMGGTLTSFFLHRALGAAPTAKPAMKPLLWLYVVPIVAAGIMGSRHVNEIAPSLVFMQDANFSDAPGYLQVLVAKRLELVLFAVLLALAVSESERPERFLGPIVAAVWVVSIAAILFFISSGASFGSLAVEARSAVGGVLGLGLHANDLGRLYAVGYALMLFMWSTTDNHRFKLLLLASMVTVVIALALTFSRGAFFGFLVVNAIYLMSRRTAVSGIFGLLFIALAIPLIPDAVITRVSEGLVGHFDANAVSAGRIDGLWLPLLPELLKSPIIGNGLSYIMWSDAMREHRILPVIHPHNAYLGALLDMGIVGLMLLGAFFVHVWRNFRRLHADPSLSPEMRGFYEGAAAGLVAFLIAAFVGSSLMPVPEQIFLWCAIGMMYGQLARRPK